MRWSDAPKIVEHITDAGDWVWTAYPNTPWELWARILLAGGVSITLMTGIELFTPIGQSAVVYVLFVAVVTAGYTIAGIRKPAFHVRLDDVALTSGGDRLGTAIPLDRIERAEHRRDAYGDSVILTMQDRSSHILGGSLYPAPARLAEAFRAKGITAISPSFSSTA